MAKVFAGSILHVHVWYGTCLSSADLTALQQQQGKDFEDLPSMPRKHFRPPSLRTSAITQQQPRFVSRFAVYLCQHYC